MDPARDRHAEYVSAWIIRDAVPEDEPCLVSMWLKSYAHSKDIREAGFPSATIDGHPDEIRFWKVHQPIVTRLIRKGSVKVACPPDRATYDHGLAVILGWACTTPTLVHWVSVKRTIAALDGGEIGRELVRDLIGPLASEPQRMTFDLLDLRKLRVIPEQWRRDNGWLSTLRTISRRRLDADTLFVDTAKHLLEAAPWLSNSERAA